MLRQRLAIKTSPMGKSHGACFFTIGGVLFWAQCLGSRTALPRQAGCMKKGKESMAVRPPDPRPFSRPRRGPHRGQVDSTGPCAIIQRSRLYLPRQRWLPCAKGAVGERRLRDWQRDASPPELHIGPFPGVARHAWSTRGSKAYSLGEFWPVRPPDPASRWHGTHAGRNDNTS